MTPPVANNTLPASEKISVTINGTKFDGEIQYLDFLRRSSVPRPVTPHRFFFSVPTTFSEVSLNDYLRHHLHLTGKTRHLPGRRMWCLQRRSGLR
ncbi:hypothetical protein RvY_16485-1 [Ramazzottius varieornatus]|uniref:Uncharacterized protein n=1 Tax=Ramazzottius varieornatus TaxID=947166 RepID=A0A1D1VZG6_RAMVA|nr:hypothetical protein RvY_16485-1 [Ramazzottius varieornatus]